MKFNSLLIVLITAVPLSWAQLSAPLPCSGPLLLKKISLLLQGGVPEKRIQAMVYGCGVTFALTPQTEDALRSAGATDSVINMIRQVAPRAVMVSPDLDGNLQVDSGAIFQIKKGVVTELLLLPGLHSIAVWNDANPTIRWSESFDVSVYRPLIINPKLQNEISRRHQMIQQQNMTASVPAVPLEQKEAEELLDSSLGDKTQRQQEKAEALQQAEKAEKENQMWEAVKARNTIPALEFYRYLFPYGAHAHELNARTQKLVVDETQKVQKVGTRATYIAGLGIFVREMTPAEVISIRKNYKSNWPGGLFVVDVFKPRIPHGFQLQSGDILQSFGHPISYSVEQERRNTLTLVADLLERLQSVSDDPYVRPTTLQWGKLAPITNGFISVSGPLIWGPQITGIIDPWGRLVKEALR